ncbi:unnamed protein product [Orchesella dallaii]|uniref:Uncharacterized protein n=1 Tax=Orchesella dallaii TaxID=48710 RepID=A0ABP1QVI5_9HEXA
MCERYFIEFPPYETVSPEFLLDESLALVNPKDILIHNQVFFIPFENKPEKVEKKRIWLRNQKKVEPDAGMILRSNIKFMIGKTKHFGLLLSQLTWVGLLNFAEKRHILHHYDDDLRAASLYIIMLKKEATGLTHFINCLHMTGNHEIANVIEAKLEMLLYGMDDYSYDNLNGASVEEWNGHFLPSKKRKTSADSGIDDEQEVEAPVNVGRRSRICRIKPLDALDVIAIINGKEDSSYKVELCKCGHYHQYPKWKDVDGEDANHYTPDSTSSGFSKYFQRKSEKRTPVQPPRQGILSPVKQPVEVGADLSHGVQDDLEFTQPRRSCSHRRLRFNSSPSFAVHPDDVEVSEQENTGSESFKSRLPRFLQKFL